MTARSYIAERTNYLSDTIGILTPGNSCRGQSLRMAFTIVIATAYIQDAGPLAQSVELCTYEVDSRYARVPSSILGGSKVFFRSPTCKKSTQRHGLR